MTEFSSNLLEWFKTSGRHDLPWQKKINPYRVWVSEIMLQQTQVKTVVPYFERFIKTFPTIDSLSSASIDRVLHLWTGLGYYARARNLHKTSIIITTQLGGQFPDTVDELVSLPGIGRSTAGAILALSMNKRASILDGNVKRVLTRFFLVQGWPEQTKIKNQLWEIADKNTPVRNFSQYTQAIMDLGATVCKRSSPECLCCPLNTECKACITDQIEHYPGKKPKRLIPTKKVFMYIVENELGEILLEQRPSEGIWGALYSFPEKLPTKMVSESLESSKELGSIPAHPVENSLSVIRHTFSHFHLKIQPKLVKVSKNEFKPNDSKHRVWYSLKNPAALGLAAPVKKLLAELLERSLQEKKPYGQKSTL